MAILNGIIPQQNFELIRDRIPIILTDELTNQATLTGDSNLNASVFSERIVPVDTANMPAVNVMFSNGSSNFFVTNYNNYVYTYFIDIYTKAKSTDLARAGYLSTANCHQLLGVCRAILESPQYRTLLFPAPSLSHTSVTDIAISEPKNNTDTESVMMGRLTFSVEVCEGVQLLDAGLIGGMDTIVKMNETDEGYIYSRNT